MLNLYKIPGIFVVGFSGRFGVGKTLSMLEQGIKFADILHLNIVANFPLNESAIRRYCRLKGFPWFAANGKITVVATIEHLLSFDNSLLLLDEAGVELFSRDYRKTDKALFNRLFRIRHYGNFLFYSCQLPSQIDKQFRDMTHLWLHCDGFQKFDIKMRRSKLYSRSIFAYSPAAYGEYIENPNIEYSKFRRFVLCQFRFSFSFFAWARLYYKFANFPITIYAMIAAKNQYKKFIFHQYCHGKLSRRGFVGLSYLAYYPFWFLDYLFNQFGRWYKFSSRVPTEDLLFACYDSFSGRLVNDTSSTSSVNVLSLFNN